MARHTVRIETAHGTDYAPKTDAGGRHTNGRAVWTAEDGWTDHGPRVLVTTDSRGRLVIVPTGTEDGRTS